MLVQPLRNIPFLKELPLIGSLPALNKDRLGLLTRLTVLGEVSGFHAGPLPFISFNQPEFIHSLLVDHACDIDKGWTMHRSFPGNGVFISEGVFHDKQRRIMAPSFTPRQIANYADTMAAYAERLAEEWHDGQEVNLTRAIAAVTTSIIGKCLFDVDVFSETEDLGKAFVTVFNHAAAMVSQPFSPPASWPTPRNRAKDRAWKVIRSRVGQMIEDRRAKPAERLDFLSLLMAARDGDGQPMSDEQLIDECVTLFAGGQETVANALGWSWYLLCQHPNVFAQVKQEISYVLQGRSPTLGDLKMLPLTLQVFKETLRLFPPAPVVIRCALKDITVENDDHTKAYQVKKGGYILANIYALHHNAALYPEPDTFAPTLHFDPAAEKALPRYSYMPFGAGPRICIGNHFALMEGHLLLATLAQRVSLKLVPGQRIEPSSKTLTTRPDVDIYVKVYRC